MIETIMICGGIATIYCIAIYLWGEWRNFAVDMSNIDLETPEFPRVDMMELEIPVPKFPTKTVVPPPHVLGTSGAWKAVSRMLDRLPGFETAANPADLKDRIEAYQTASERVRTQMIARAEQAANEQRSNLEQWLNRLATIEKPVEKQIRARLNEIAAKIETMAKGGFWERQRAKGLRRKLSRNERNLDEHLRGIRQEAKARQTTIQNWLTPAWRAESIAHRLQSQLSNLNEIAASKELAGAIAEVEVINELAKLPEACRIINDITLEAPHYIHNRGNPIQSAQIDTLVITPAGVFVVEVKNWSREFAESGQGFNPYEQVSRARQLVWIILQEAGLRHVKVRAIVATQGRLPAKKEEFVAVKQMTQLRGYIRWFNDSNVDVPETEDAIRRWQQ
jgi:hypothetical protein